MVKPISYLCLLGIGLGCLLSFKPNVKNSYTDDLSPIRTAKEEAGTFQLEPGLKIQLVAAEPMVQDPVVITFDADGRLWVVEMRGFMTDIDGNNEKQPTGRVSVLEDTNGDGQMDISHVYLDSLVLPRALALVPGGALVAENEALWLTQDTNGDLKADTKTLIDAKYAAGGLPEHSGNGLWRGMDNWYYNAKSRLRYRLVDGKWLRDSTEFRGQWGISHDDKGRLYYNYNWSQLHADLVPPNYLSRNRHHTPTTGIDFGVTLDRRIYPIRTTLAVNRGYVPGTLDKEGHLQEFTAACSPLVYRGTALPTSFEGNVFVCEPAGNLIKRNVVQENGLLLAAHDPHPGREFLASTDERFRPVHMATGPDGALYIADMYRGLIQHKAYITPYLREQTLSRKLDMPVHCGRIWRIVPENWQVSRPKKLTSATTDELVVELSSADGWHRDMAQRLLVERNDKQASPALIQLAQTGNSDLRRLHALWTLDGLALNQPAVLFPLLTDKSSLIRATATRLLEPFAKTDPAVRAKLGTALLGLEAKAPIEQILQMALTAQVLDSKASHPLLATIAARYSGVPLIRDAVLSSLHNQEFAFLQRLWKAPQWQTQDPTKEIFLEMLTTTIVKKGNPNEMTALKTMSDSPTKTKSWQQRAVLSSLSLNASDKIANPINSAKTFSLGADDQKLFVLGRQQYLTTCAGCHGNDGGGLKRFAPPLNGSDWVTGDEKRLALIVLHGMEGAIEVAGKKYDAPEILPVMPAHSTMDDAAITAILMYIRNAWGNDAGPINKRLVGTTRVMSQGRVMPWTAKELNKQLLEAKETGGK